MIYWLVLKLQINYKVKYLEGLWFLLEDFLKINIFLHGEIFEFS
jgi:hypothetical protein